MSTISTHLRNFKEPSKDQLTQLFFSIPETPPLTANAEKIAEQERMEISAVLTLSQDAEEDPYVRFISAANVC